MRKVGIGITVSTWFLVRIYAFFLLVNAVFGMKEMLLKLYLWPFVSIVSFVAGFNMIHK